MAAIPSIACLGVIGKNNNPLHISLFPSAPHHSPIRSPLEFSFLLSSTLDIFDARLRGLNFQSATGPGSITGTQSIHLSGDLGLLHAIDERLTAYGFETNTAVKFVAIVDMFGRIASPGSVAAALGKEGAGSGGATGMAVGGLGLKDGDLKGLFKAMNLAYVRLLQNPFYDPDVHCPPNGLGGKKIESRVFEQALRKIGEGWLPGVL